MLIVEMTRQYNEDERFIYKIYSKKMAKWDSGNSGRWHS